MFEILESINKLHSKKIKTKIYTLRNYPCIHSHTKNNYDATCVQVVLVENSDPDNNKNRSHLYKVMVTFDTHCSIMATLLPCCTMVLVKVIVVLLNVPF